MDKQTFYNHISTEELTTLLDTLHTPCYVYFLSMLRERIKTIRQSIGERFEIHYALKANPNIELLKVMAEADIGADVASGGELDRAIKAGISPDLIEFSGPGKNTKEIEQSLLLNIGSINAESIEELHTIIAISNKKQQKARVGLRVNPVGIKGRTGMKMAGDTQFGIAPSDIPAALKLLRDNQDCLAFTGIHSHMASQELNAEILAGNFAILLDLAAKITEEAPQKIGKVNFGGGWGLNYFHNQTSLNILELGERLNELIELPRHKDLLKDTQLIVEPGRYLVGECGIFATRVLYRKRSESKQYAIVDGGMNANYILAGGMGQVIRRNSEMDILTQGKNRANKKTTLDIAGPLCTPQDVLAQNITINHEVNQGDTIVFFNCGAYGASASPINFLSHPPPVEYIHNSGTK